MRIKRDKLDDLFSEFIRRRAIAEVGGCERCLRPKVDIVKDNGDIFPAWKQLECSHFVGRGNQATRYDEDNACALDFGCHQYFTSHPLEHTEWFAKRLGEDKFNMLLGRMRNTWPHPDKKLIEIYLKEKLKEVNNDSRNMV